MYAKYIHGWESTHASSIRPFKNKLLPDEKNKSYYFSYTYNEQIHAIYSLWSGKLGKTSIQSGLRLEQTLIDGKQDVNNEEICQNYLNLYPSLSLIHPLNKNNELQLSYSRTIKKTPGTNDQSIYWPLKSWSLP